MVHRVEGVGAFATQLLGMLPAGNEGVLQSSVGAQWVAPQTQQQQQDLAHLGEQTAADDLVVHPQRLCQLMVGLIRCSQPQADCKLEV